MFCSKYATKKVSSTHARALRAINMGFTTSRDNLLDMYDEIPIHTYNLRCLLTEVYKSLHGLNPEFIWDLFAHKSVDMDFRHGLPLALPAKVDCFADSIVFRATMAWNYLPASLKQSLSLSEFKSDISKMVTFYGHCKTCS